MKIINTLQDGHIEELVRLYQHEWWSGGRREAEVRKMLANSQLNIAIVDDTQQLIAYARVLTDWVFKALIFDIIVKQEWRSRGLGKMLIEKIVEHPRLRQVKHLELYCLKEMIPFYQKWDFEVVSNESFLLMRRSHEQ